MTTPSLRGEGLARRLGYPVTRPARVQRAVQVLAVTRPVAWALSRTLRPVDEILTRIGSRVTVPSVVAGLPAVTLVTTGAARRQVHVFALEAAAPPVADLTA